MKKFKFTLALLLLFVSFFSFGQNSSPNIVIIQVDDMGFDDLSINGSTISSTPYIDELSKESVRFDNFMVNSVCAPTRASLLTGRDFWKTGVSGVHGGKDFLNLEETTFANIFQDNGYKTGMWGKWHSGKADGYWPWDRGFDEAYYAKLYKYYPSSGWYNEYPKQVIHDGEWSPKVIVDYAVDFISKNKNTPFLAYVSLLSVHETWETPEVYRNKFRKSGRSERLATLLGMLSFMDDEIGRLLNHLSSQGLDENTIVIFMSDNGPSIANQSKEEWALRNPHKFVGNKARVWQNGLKSPLYIRWKNNFVPSNVNRLVGITDVFPTLLDIANLNLPANNLPIDGRSILSYLNGDTQSLSEKEGIFTHWHPNSSKGSFEPLSKEEVSKLKFEDQRMTIMDEHYKYLYNANNADGGARLKGGVGLIDLKEDPMESKNIVDKYPEIAQKYKSKIRRWFDDIKNTEDTFNSPVFQIGWNNKEISEIQACGSYETQGVLNDSHGIRGFNQPGDYAKYNLNVLKSGTYKVTMERLGKKINNGFKMRISVGENESTSETCKNILSDIGEINLNKGLQLFKLELISSLNSQEDIGAIKSIKFQRVSK